MSTLADLHEPLVLDPDAPRPPFRLSVDLPVGWSVLDTNPRTWRRSAEALVDRFSLTPITRDERKPVLDTLESLVGRCQTGGVSLGLVVLGRLQPGTAFSAGMLLAFVRGTTTAGLGPARELAGRSGVATELEGAGGPFLVHRSRSTTMVPGTATIVGLTHLQAFVPLPDSPWTAVLSTSTPHVELTDPLDRVLTVVAGSLVRADHQGTDTGAGDDDRAAVTYEAVDTDPMPGLGKGFGTMLRRTVAAPDENP